MPGCHFQSLVNIKPFFRQVLILMLFISMEVCGQTNHPSIIPVAQESMSSSFVRCILKDHSGFMWFGTNNGLVRYDGTNAYWYRHIQGDKNSISDNRINVLLEDKNNILWIGTGQGLVRYNRE